jgi:hypothetical protein
MNINTLMSAIRQHMQKRYIITAQTETLVSQIATSVIEGHLSPEQFFDEVVLAIQAYAHPMMFEEERPFVIKPASSHYNPEARFDFFHVCSNAEGNGWHYGSIDQLKRIDKTNAKSIIMGGIYALMGDQCMPIRKSDNRDNALEGNTDILFAMRQICQVTYQIQNAQSLRIFKEALADRDVMRNWRGLYIGVELSEIKDGLDLTSLRNLTWLRIQAGYNHDLSRMLLDGTIKLPEGIQFLSISQSMSDVLTWPLNSGEVRVGDKTAPIGFRLTEGTLNEQALRYASAADQLKTFYRIEDEAVARSAAAVFGMTPKHTEELYGHFHGLYSPPSWWRHASLEHHVLAWNFPRLSLPSLISYKGPVELLEPSGCSSLRMLQPHNGIFGAASWRPQALTLQRTHYYSPLPSAETSVGLLKAQIAKRFKSVEAVSTAGLVTKSRQELNKTISMVELHHDSIECYRRYYLQER